MAFSLLRGDDVTRMHAPATVAALRMRTTRRRGISPVYRRTTLTCRGNRDSSTRKLYASSGRACSRGNTGTGDWNGRHGGMFRVYLPTLLAAVVDVAVTA